MYEHEAGEAGRWRARGDDAAETWDVENGGEPMTPLRWERDWKGYKVGKCRHPKCDRGGGVVNFDGLCKSCNEAGPDGRSPEARIAVHTNRGKTTANAGWRTFSMGPKSDPRPDPRPKR